MLHVCTMCHSVDKPKKVTPGSFIMEVFLWMLFFFPGIIYSLWRVTNKKKVCKCCGSEHIVPKESIAAKKIMSAS